MRLITLMVLTLISCVSHAQEENVFEHPAGLKVTKPNDWYFDRAVDLKTKFQNIQLRSEAFQRMLEETDYAPLVVMNKYKAGTVLINATLKFELKPYGPLEGMNEIQILQAHIPAFMQMLDAFAVLDYPERVSIGGLPGASMTMEYYLEHKTQGSLPITSKLWVVPRGDYYFLIGFGASQREPKKVMAEVESIIESLDLTI